MPACLRRIDYTSGTLVHFTPVVEKRAAVVLVRAGGSEMAFALAGRLLRVVWDQGNTRGGTCKKEMPEGSWKILQFMQENYFDDLRNSVMKSFNGS